MEKTNSTNIRQNMVVVKLVNSFHVVVLLAGEFSLEAALQERSLNFVSEIVFLNRFEDEKT